LTLGEVKHSFPLIPTDFTDRHGQRSAVLIMDLKDASQIPAIAEPWFLLFEAGVEIHPVMGPQELASAGLGGRGKEWS
jgi:hypothetical protein